MSEGKDTFGGYKPFPGYPETVYVPPIPADCPTPSTPAALSGIGDPTGVATPEFIGQLYHDTDSDTYYRSTGLTSADWTAISGGGGSNLEGAGDPGGSLVVDFIGQRYKDTNTGNIWIANSTTAGDWTLEVQNARLTWEPRTARLLQRVGLLDYVGFTGITKIVIGEISNANGYDIEGASGVTDIEFPNLVTIGSGNGFVLQIDTLATLSAPNLVSCGSNFSITSLQFAALNLPAFTTESGQFYMSSNPLLATVAFPNYLPTNGKTVDFSFCALTAASVNHILARCVANSGYVTGLVDLSGGTNAAPTGQGIIDKATLNARHAGLAVTN